MGRFPSTYTKRRSDHDASRLCGYGNVALADIH